MNFGKALVGAILGGAIGIVAHAAIEYAIGEASWLPVVMGLIIGICVRTADRSALATASYARGALAALVALGSVFAAVTVTSSTVILSDQTGNTKIEQPQSNDPATPQDASEEPDEDADDEVAKEEGEGEDAPAQPTERGVSSMPIVINDAPLVAINQEFSVWNFAFIAVGAFLAYELARGGSNPPPQTEPATEGDDAETAGADSEQRDS